MNAATPRDAVEGSQIVPYRSWIQGRVFHPCHESGRRMGFPLDVTDSSIAMFGDGDSEIEASIAGAERQAEEIISVGGAYSHNGILRRLLVGRSEMGSQASIG